MGRRKGVRLEHIAEEMGVSIVTVSNALKGRKGVSEELREEIRKMADRLGYQVAAEKKKKRESYIIGVIVAERYVKEFPSFYMDVYKRVAQEATKRGSMTILEIADKEKESMEHGFAAFQDAEIAGIIIIGEMNREYICEVRKEYPIPVVCVDYYDVEEGLDYIVTDSYGGMEQVTGLLLDKGYRELSFVGTPGATGNITDRYLGYCKALEKRGMEVKAENVIADRTAERYDYKIDVKLPEKLPEAFVCNCDKTAHVVISKLQERGVRIPEDAAIVGFDHYYSQAQNGLELTTYENDEKAIAHISVSTLIKRIEGKKKNIGVRIVEGKIVHGNTVGNKLMQEIGKDR